MLSAALFALFVFGLSASGAVPRTARRGIEAAGGERSHTERDDPIKSTGRLLGGASLINYDEWTFYATLKGKYNKWWMDDFYCPGLVFNKRTIITTAQCVEKTKSVNFNTTSLTVDCGSDNVQVTVLKTKTHDDYVSYVVQNQTVLPNDIGVVILNQDLVLDQDRCWPAHLPCQDQDTQPQSLTVIGYDTYYLDPTDYRKIEVNLLAEDVCAQEAGQSYDSNMHICLRDPDQAQAACLNDHSTPAILHDCDKTVVGLGSWIFFSCTYWDFSKPAYYVRLSHYINWIHAHAE